MTELFLRVLQMSLMAAGVVLIALPLRWLFRRLRLPALACELLWLVVAVRMLLPVGLVTGPFSVLGWLTPAVQEQTEALARTEEMVLLPAAPDPAPPAEPAPSFALPEAVPAAEEAAPAAEGLSVLDVLAWLWLAGVLAVWGYMALAWLRLRRRLATAVWRGSAQMGWWWESDRIPTAFVFGFFTPRVYVPAGVEGETLRWVLLHERAHIKLGHHRYKAVYFLLAGLHWFNPMLWLSWVLLGRDLEVACDEKVLGSACGSPREYSAALLALASPNRGPLLPPGFGETGVKDRIRRALKWKPAAPWMAAVLFVLAVALGLLLLNDPPFPDPTVNGQYPTLRIQMEQDGPGGAGGETVVNMGVPEAATWPEELPETERTASTPRPWVSLYLDNGAFPSRWTMTEYLVENGQAVWPREVGLSPYGAGNGWLLRLESREDAPGAGMETRLYVLSCTWQEGIRTHELEYAFRLNLPSVPPGPLTEPVVVAGDTRVDLDGDASATAAMGKTLTITHPDRPGSCMLYCGDPSVVPDGFMGQVGGGAWSGHGRCSLTLGYVEPSGMRACEPGDPPMQEQRYTLSYTWEDGSHDNYYFTVYAYDPQTEWRELGIPLPEGQWMCTRILDETQLIFSDPEGNLCAAYTMNGEDRWRVSRYIDDPEAISLADLPWPAYETEGEFVPDPSNWYDDPVKLVGLSGDRTAAVFAFDPALTGQEGLLFCTGGRLTYFPELAFVSTPQMTPITLNWGDYDGDGADELAAVDTVGTGTGVLMENLYVFEWDGSSLTLGGRLDSYQLQDRELGLPDGQRTGSWVLFWAEGDALYAQISVEDAAGVPTLSVVGQLTGPVDYGGEGRLTLPPEELVYTAGTGE